ncbi:MAG: aspartate-semialdehyde dehydrogenase [Acidobacteria bacterium]|nr:aspartate-semialdehyde dehydrogenase [Acidobacteriota bacterium]
MKKIPVAILGATGAVGQQFVTLLASHPWFEVRALMASERSTGKTYGEAVSWKQAGPLPQRLAAVKVEACEPGGDFSIAFSALDAAVAGGIEKAFAAAGHVVVSNSRNHRLEPDVPLILPELNADHLEVIPGQKKNRRWKGCIVTNSNCSTMFLAMALGPIHRRYGVEKVFVTTMQAISGAGYPGVPSWDILGNVIPFISGEEEKIETETRKILGFVRDARIELATFTVSAQTNRVPVENGHTECVSLALRSPARPKEIAELLSGFTGLPQQLKLPSAPVHPILVRSEPDRPQPRMDVMTENGMSTVVGRIRPCPILDVRMVLLGHNTIRGAAGAAILNAELLKVQKYL